MASGIELGGIVRTGIGTMSSSVQSGEVEEVLHEQVVI